MNVVLRNSRKLIGTLTGTTSIGDGISLPVELKAHAYRRGQGVVGTQKGNEKGGRF
jgi:hypothetical protein